MLWVQDFLVFCSYQLSHPWVILSNISIFFLNIGRSHQNQPPASKGSYSQVGFSYEGDGKEEPHYSDDDDNDEDGDDEYSFVLTYWYLFGIWKTIILVLPYKYAWSNTKKMAILIQCLVLLGTRSTGLIWFCLWSSYFYFTVIFPTWYLTCHRWNSRICHGINLHALHLWIPKLYVILFLMSISVYI